MSADDTVIIDRVTPRAWRRILEAARDLDLDKGGYCDPRSGVVNFWCGPADKPSGWPADLEIRRGALSFPRSYAGGASLEWGEDDADWRTDRPYPIELEITCYEAQEYRVRQLRAGDPRERPPSREERASWFRCEGDEAWCRDQWQRLKRYALPPRPIPSPLVTGALDRW